MVKETSLKRTPCKPKDFMEVDFAINDAVAVRMYKALSVIALDPDIKSFLYILDPKALQQVEDAMEEYKSSYQESNIDNH